MALKSTNKNRQPSTLTEKSNELTEHLIDETNPLATHWVPVDKFAPHETDRTIKEVTGWVPLDKLAPHETEETYKEYLASLGKNS